jgi:hypothetical protein
MRSWSLIVLGGFSTGRAPLSILFAKPKTPPNAGAKHSGEHVPIPNRDVLAGALACRSGREKSQKAQKGISIL